MSKAFREVAFKHLSQRFVKPSEPNAGSILQNLSDWMLDDIKPEVKIILQGFYFFINLRIRNKNERITQKHSLFIYCDAERDGYFADACEFGSFRCVIEIFAVKLPGSESSSTSQTDETSTANNS